MSNRLTQRQYIATIAVISVSVLVLGVLLRPKQSAEPTISEEETQRLQILTQRRNLENLAVFFSQVVGGIQPSLVWLNEIAMTGLVWNQEGLIVSAGPNQLAPAEVTALTASGNLALEAQVLSANFQVSSLKEPPGPKLQPVKKGTARGLTPGTWIIQVARQAGGHYLFTPGVYGGIAIAKCGTFEYQALQTNFPLTQSALGGGLFDVDGNLLAVVLRCNDNFAAVIPADIDREIARADSFEGKLLQGYGLQVTAIDDTSQKYFQCKEGAVVKEVTDMEAADAATLVPGDVIVALDKAPVTNPGDLAPLTMPHHSSKFQLDVLRNRRIVRIDLKPNASHTPGEDQGADDPGIALTDLPQGYLVGAVVHGSPAEHASIQAGDRLLLIDGKRPPSFAAARKILSDRKRGPIFVQIQRGSRKIGILLN